MSYKKIHAFGLDISDYSLECVLLHRKKKVKLFLREKLPFGIVVNGKIKNKQALGENLIKLKTKAGSKLNTDNVILSLPENKVFAHIFSIPKSLVNDPKVILKLAQEHIPLDLNTSIFDYKIIKDKDLPKNEKRIYFVAVEEKLVFDYLEVLTLAKLKPIAIDIEPDSLARALEYPHQKAVQNALAKKLQSKIKKKRQKKKKKTENPPESADQSVDEMIKEALPTAEIVLDFGAKHSVVTIFYDSHVFPSISIPTGGHTFTQIIQKEFKINNFDEAQKIKNKLTLKSEKYKKIQNLFEAKEDKIVREIQSLINYFEKNNEIVVKTLHVTGGSSKLVGFFEYLKSKLKLKIKKAKACIENQTKIDSEIYLNAIGLALRGISKDPVTAEINLLPPHQKRLLVEQQAKSAIIYSSLVVLFISSLLIASFNIVLSNLYFDLEGLEKANTSFQKIVEGTRYQEIEAHIQELNDSAQLARQTLEETYSIESIYKHFYANVPPLLVINQFNYQNKAGKHQIEVNGFALKRDNVLELQEIMQNTTFYNNLVAPLSNLLKQNDIYFAFNFEVDLVKFQEYLAEKKRKAEEEAAKGSDSTVSETNFNPQDTTATFTSENNTGNTTEKKNTETFRENSEVTENQTEIMISLEENLIDTQNLEELNHDLKNLSENIEETENIEDQQIEEILQNSNNEYPFQDKIHQKVGDVFVIEQTFHSGSGASTEE